MARCPVHDQPFLPIVEGSPILACPVQGCKVTVDHRPDPPKGHPLLPLANLPTQETVSSDPIIPRDEEL